MEETAEDIPVKHKIIAEGSEEYAAFRAEMNVSERAQPFGRMLASLVKKDAPEFFLKPETAQIRKRLSELALRPQKSRFVNSLFNEFSNKKVESMSDEEQLLFFERWGEMSDITGILDVANRQEASEVIKNMDDSMIQELIVFHTENFELKRSDHEQQLQQWKLEFFETAQKAITDGLLPITSEQLKDRLDHLNLTLGDGLNSVSRSGDLYGVFTDPDETATVFQQAIRLQGKPVTFHELMHAISGRTIYKITAQNHHALSEDNRVGLHFHALEPGMSGRFQWLNEAINEDLTLQLLNEEDSQFYSQNRNLFRLIMESGNQPIDRSIFVNAFFENFDPNLPPEQRIPEWKNLYRTLNEAYAPGFLLKLDLFIKAHGLDSAIKQMTSDWKIIAQFKPPAMAKADDLFGRLLTKVKK